MADEGWQLAQELFAEALTRPADGRLDFLRNACGGDRDLFDNVASLLEEDSAAEPGFLRPPQPLAGAAGRDSEEDHPLGRTLGQYEIEGVIGRGGMSTVYAAVQRSPRRTVALKVMLASWCGSGALRRFETESRILARLQHPHIAQVYEAGVAEAVGSAPRTLLADAIGTVRHADPTIAPPLVSFFAMEYIPNARTITAYTSARGLDTRERLALFLQVCDAVQHAHGRGIIHRDLKPGNILVADEVGSALVKVIDFGVARATDIDVALTTMHTQAGQLIGTLQYMSPEQCDADPDDLDIRSDVYSLGVVLYELVVGRLPYETAGSSIYRATRVIKESAPAGPSSIDRRLRSDLETIVLKALEKDRDRRYPSAADLARDIRHYLNKEPIEARPPTRWVRMARWVGRHPAAVTAASCVGIGIVSLFVNLGTVWYMDRVPDEIKVRNDRLEARLLARSGAELRKFPTPPGPAINGHLLVEHPLAHGKRVALLGYGAAPNHPLGGALCAYWNPADESVSPICYRIEQQDVPESCMALGETAELSGVTMLGLADVFDGSPGEEIIAMHNWGSSSPRAIRILDLRGNVLFQVWHDGHVFDWHWMPGPRLLIMVAINSEYTWSPQDARNANPFVVLAVSPERGMCLNQFLSAEAGDEPTSPAWYKWLHYPFADVELGEFALITPVGSAEVESTVELTFYIQQNKEHKVGLGWTIDAEGNMVPGTQAGNDHFNRDKSLPPKELFELRDEPPAKLRHLGTPLDSP